LKGYVNDEPDIVLHPLPRLCAYEDPGTAAGIFPADKAGDVLFRLTFIDDNPLEVGAVLEKMIRCHEKK